MAAVSIKELSSGQHVQPFVIMAKSTKSASALQQVIKQALSAPNLFVFGELLAMDNIKAMKTATGEPKLYHELLEIFAYGLYSDYTKRDDLPKLTEAQLLKLRQLTIAGLASTNRTLAYTMLLKELAIPNLRDLEDLIIESIYQGVLVAKLDQEHSQLQVETVISRDVRPEEIGALLSKLETWVTNSESLMKDIKAKVHWGITEQERAKKAAAAYEERISEIKKNIKAVMDDGMGDAPGYDDMMMGNLKSRKGRKGGRKSRQKHGGRNYGGF